MLGGGQPACVIVGIVAAALVGCADPRPHNLLVVTLDTTRADHLGAYGYEPARTPAFDRLAAEGLLAADAIAATPITMPSHATIFTGLLPPAHGVRDNGSFVLPAAAHTLAERLQERGFATAAFLSAIVLDSRYGLDQGFELYDDDLASEDQPKLFMIRDRPARRTAPRVVEWLEAHTQRPERPFFVWTHFFDAHQPWEAPLSEKLITTNAYDAEIAAADRGLANLLAALDRLGLAERTLVVVTADHGESLGEHGEKTHALFVYDATVRVPLVMRAPGLLRAGSRYGGPVHHADLMPTILDALGYPVTDAEALDGVSLLDALRGREAAPRRGQYSESLLAELGFGMAPLRAIRDDGWKWIDAPRPELYDLRADPRELQDLALAQPRRGAALARSLDQVIEHSEARAVGSQAANTDSETLEALRALGYLAAPEERAGFAGIDPKDGVRWYSVLEDARHAAQRERWQEAVDLLQPLLEEVPGNVSARNVIALAWLRLGEVEKAHEAYTRSLSDYPEQPRVLLALAGIELSAGAIEAARALCQRALELQPAAVEAMAHLGLIAAIDGDETEAQQWFERAIGLDPTTAHARRRFADLRFEQGRWSEAAQLYAETVRVAPNDAGAWLQLGAASRRLGDSERAHAAYRRAAELRPDWWIPRFNQACLWSIEGELDRAFADLAAAIALDPRAAHAARDDADLESLRRDPRFAALLRPHRP